MASLAQTATTAVSQAMPQMMGLMIRSATGGLAGGNFDAPGAPQTQQRTKGQKSRQRPENLSQSRVAIPDSSDPAYQAAVSSKEPVNLLASILGVGTDKGIDWEKFSPTAVNTKGGMTFIETMISHTLKNTQWTNGEASAELKDALEKVQTVSCLKALRTVISV